MNLRFWRWLPLKECLLGLCRYEVLAYRAGSMVIGSPLVDRA